MTNREDMIETAARAAYGYVSKDMAWQIAGAVLDAILPQITTVEELEALPVGSKVVDCNGDVWDHMAVGDDHAAKYGPLTVVWQPT